MTSLAIQAMPVVKNLLQSDEDQLYEQLGIRAKAMAEDLQKSSSFEPQVTYNQAQMGFKEDVRKFGLRLFRRWNIETHKLICGSDPEDKKDREELMNAFNVDDVTAAAVLSALLVTHLGLAPAIAAVIAALAIKRFFRPAYEEFCQTWKESLSEEETS